MANDRQAKTLSSHELDRLIYPLPKSWLRAAGLLRHRRKALERHLRIVRNEWDRRSVPYDH